MKVGDYVRTKDGIAKIKSFELKTKEVINLDKDIMLCNMDIYRNCCTISQVIKSSPNIMDLIEVGDYVNGCMVINKKDDTIQIIQLILPFDLKEKDIKSIITHEQFESMQYNLESEVN